MAEPTVLKLVEHSDNGAHWSVEDMLQDLLNKSEAIKRYPKAIVLLLDDTGDGYIPTFSQAGMVRSEIIALLEIAKQKFIRDLVESQEPWT